MYTIFENKPKLGDGIYTIPDISMIFKIPNYKVNHWIKAYWNNESIKNENLPYNWLIDRTRGVSFLTLVELYVFYEFYQAGVKSNDIFKAHKILTETYKTDYPFANKIVIDQLRTDGKEILFQKDHDFIVSLNGTFQLKLELIKLFFKKIEFNEDSLASKLYPIGKEKSIVCDPKRRFGQPVIDGTNILAATVNDLVKAGDSIKFVAITFNLSERQIHDAIEYCGKAA